jgi:hypothetical protein
VADLVRSAGGGWNFRGQAAQGEVLSRIREGEGLEDLIADLDALADLCEGNRAAFARDQLFDLEGSITAARQQADALRQVLSSARLDDEQLRARDLRDRAWTHLNGLLTELRQAGRYAWQSDAEMSARFTSPYLRRRPRRRPQDA